VGSNPTPPHHERILETSGVCFGLKPQREKLNEVMERFNLERLSYDPQKNFFLMIFGFLFSFCVLSLILVFQAARNVPLCLNLLEECPSNRKVFPKMPFRVEYSLIKVDLEA